MVYDRKKKKQCQPKRWCDNIRMCSLVAIDRFHVPIGFFHHRIGAFNNLHRGNNPRDSCHKAQHASRLPLNGIQHHRRDRRGCADAKADIEPDPQTGNISASQTWDDDAIEREELQQRLREAGVKPLVRKRRSASGCMGLDQSHANEQGGKDQNATEKEKNSVMVTDDVKNVFDLVWPI